MAEIDKELEKELKGLLKEQVADATASIGKDIEELKEKAAAQEEANAKRLENDTELKARLDSMQDKKFKGSEKMGGHTYIFKGYNPDLSKNFKSTLTTEQSEAVAKAYLTQRDDVWKAFDGADAIPVQYGTAVMGLAELSSVALAHADVRTAEAPVVKFPAKGTRGSVDSQASATANKEDTPTIGQITWTIDKRVGNYIEVLNDQLDDANFDLVNQIIVPMQAEAVGQNADDEMFNGTEFTSSVSDATASVTASGTAGIAAAVTFANLNTMFYAVEWERGLLNPKFFGSRAALKDVAGLLDSQNRPIFQQVPINGRPSQTLMGAEYVICPSISDTPAANAIRLAFGDPKQYVIYVRGGTLVSMVNPYVKMKEDVTQFICKARMDGNIADHATPASSGAWTTMQRVDA